MLEWNSANLGCATNGTEPIILMQLTKIPIMTLAVKLVISHVTLLVPLKYFENKQEVIPNIMMMKFPPMHARPIAKALFVEE
jgi:hypothetical protein